MKHRRKPQLIDMPAIYELAAQARERLDAAETLEELEGIGAEMLGKISAVMDAAHPGSARLAIAAVLDGMAERRPPEEREAFEAFRAKIEMAAESTDAERNTDV